MNDPKMIAKFLREADVAPIIALGYIEKAADAIEQLVNDYEILAKMYAKVNEDLCVRTKERDAAVDDLKGLHDALEGRGLCCYACKNDVFDYDKSVCAGCALQDNWEWRGVQEDNDETD